MKQILTTTSMCIAISLAGADSNKLHLTTLTKHTDIGSLQESENNKKVIECVAPYLDYSTLYTVRSVSKDYLQLIDAHIDEQIKIYTNNDGKRPNNVNYLWLHKDFNIQVFNTQAQIILYYFAKNRLQITNVPAVSIDANLVKPFCKMLEHNTTIDTLDLRSYLHDCYDSSVLAESTEEFAKSLSKNSSITRLSLGSNFLWRSRNRECIENPCDYERVHTALGQLLQNNSSIKTVALDSNFGDPIEVNGSSALFDGLCKNTTVTHLDMQQTNLKFEAAKQLSHVLKCNSSLKILDLSVNLFNHEGIKLLAHGLKSNSTLCMLNLSANSVKSDGASALGYALENNNTLTVLVLNSAKIDDEGATALAKGLKENKTLTVLDLSNNRINDLGIQKLAKSLKKNTALCYLVLGKNKIQDGGAKALAVALKCNSTLVFLDMSTDVDTSRENEQNILKSLNANQKITNLNSDQIQSELTSLGIKNDPANDAFTGTFSRVKQLYDSFLSNHICVGDSANHDDHLWKLLNYLKEQKFRIVLLPGQIAQEKEIDSWFSEQQ